MADDHPGVIADARHDAGGNLLARLRLQEIAPDLPEVPHHHALGDAGKERRLTQDCEGTLDGHRRAQLGGTPGRHVHYVLGTPRPGQEQIGVEVWLHVLLAEVKLAGRFGRCTLAAGAEQITVESHANVLRRQSRALRELNPTAQRRAPARSLGF